MLVPKDASLTSLENETYKVVNVPVNYLRGGYTVDKDVIRLEEDEREGDKNVFDFWMSTSAGTTRNVEVHYVNAAKIPIKSGSVYTFVFDKQSGVKGGVEFSFDAPAGFKWRESGKSTFVYKNEDPEKRIELHLTLEQI